MARMPSGPEFGPDPERLDLSVTTTERSPDTSSDEMETQSSDVPLYESIGSGGVNIDINPNTGDATETISGSGGTTRGVTTEGTTDVVTVTSDSSQQELESTEQEIENITDGTAFGNDTLDDIGSGEAVVTTTPSDPAASGGMTSSGSGSLSGLMLAALVAVAAVLWSGVSD